MLFRGAEAPLITRIHVQLCFIGLAYYTCSQRPEIVVNFHSELPAAMNNTRRPIATAIHAGLSKLSWLTEPIQSKSRTRFGLAASWSVRGAVGVIVLDEALGPLICVARTTYFWESWCQRP